MPVSLSNTLRDLLRELLLQQFPQTTILSTYVRSSSCEVTQATFNAVLQLRNKMSSMRLSDVQIHDPGQTTSAGYRSWGLEALKLEEDFWTSRYL